MQPWRTPGHPAPGQDGAQELSIHCNSLQGIIHGLVTTYQEGQWAFIVLLPITPSQAYLPIYNPEDASEVTHLPQGSPKETAWHITRYLPHLCRLA